MAVAQQTFQQLTTAGLDQLDPEIARDLLGREVERQRNQIELIASRTHLVCDPGGSRLDADDKRRCAELTGAPTQAARSPIYRMQP